MVQVSSDSIMLLLLVLWLVFKLVLELLRFILLTDKDVLIGDVGEFKPANWFRVKESAVWFVLLLLLLLFKLDVLLLLLLLRFAFGFKRLNVDDEDELDRCADLRADESKDTTSPLDVCWCWCCCWGWLSANDRDMFEKLRSINWFILCDTPFFR